MGGTGKLARGLPTTRAAIYVRISRDPEGRELGVRRQERDCRDLVKRRRWQVADTYQDNDVSASGRKRRPQWERLMRDVEEGRVDALVAYSSSRMYRNLRDLTKLIDLADQGAVQIATVASGNIDLSTADGRMLARMLATVDQAEWERTSERGLREASDYARAGKRRGGRRAFGYTAELRRVPAEARAIRQGADMVLSEGANAHQVAVAWNRAGVLTPTGNRWRIEDVRRVLTSAMIAGLREHRRNGKLLGTYDATWPTIVSREEHEALCSLLINGKRRNGQLARKHFLSGVLVCDKCHGPMLGRTQPDGRRAYACATVDGEKGHSAVGANAAEDYVLDAVRERDPDYTRKQRLTRPQPEADRETLLALARIAEQRATLEQAGELGANVSTAVARVDAEERTLRESVRPADEGRDPEKDDPDRRDRRHRGELTEAEVLQSQAWVRRLVESANVRAAKHTREPAADRITIRWR